MAFASEGGTSKGINTSSYVLVGVSTLEECGKLFKLLLANGFTNVSFFNDFPSAKENQEPTAPAEGYISDLVEPTTSTASCSAIAQSALIPKAPSFNEVSSFVVKGEICEETSVVENNGPHSPMVSRAEAVDLRSDLEKMLERLDDGDKDSPHNEFDHDDSSLLPANIVKSLLGNEIELTTSHRLVELAGPRKSVRRRCVGCYKRLTRDHGRPYALNHTRRVCLRCSECRKHFCPDCFQAFHKTCVL